jgi:hypothetical protein
MAAVTTKKPGGDFAVQMTFPKIFSEEYAALGLPLGYASFGSYPATQIPRGGLDDVQDAYYEQKRIDADRMAMAKVMATRNAEDYYLRSNNGYLLPKPVLSQRVFANPSMGSGGMGGDLYSARLTAPDPRAPFTLTARGLHGGVLRTAEGQRWAARAQQARVQQLDAIDSAKAAFETGVALAGEPTPTAIEMGVEQGLPTEKQNLMIEFQQLVGGLLSALTSGAELDRFTYSDLARYLTLLFRLAPAANREELEDMKTSADEMADAGISLQTQAAEGYDTGRRGQHAPPNRRFFAVVVPLLELVAQYVDKMLAGVYLQPKDRRALSRNLIRSLGFLKRLTEYRKTELTPAERERRARLGADDDDGDDDDDGGDQFTREAAPRELGAAAAAAAESTLLPRFERDYRQTFGARSGAYLGEQLPSLEVGELAGAVPTNIFRQARDNRMPVRAYAAAAPAPEFADVGAPEGYEAAAAALAPRSATPPNWKRFNTTQKKAALRSFAESGATLEDARATTGVKITKKLWDEATEGLLVPAQPVGRLRAKRSEDIRKWLSAGPPAASAAAAAPAPRVAAAAAAAAAPAGRGIRSPEPGRRVAAATAVAAPAARARSRTPARRRDIPADFSGRGRKMTPALIAHRKLGRGSAQYAKKAAAAAAAPAHGLTRATLPKTREGFVELAAAMSAKGQPIRVNSGSTLASIRANFIKKFKL